MDTLSIKQQETPTWHLFLVVVLVSLLLHYIANEFLLLPEVYYRSFASKLSEDRIAHLLANREQLMWVGYLIEIAEVTAKVLAMGLLLTIGAYFFEYKLKFRDAVAIAITASLVPLAAEAVKVLWFSISDAPFTLKDFNSASMLSLQQLFTHPPLWLVGILKWISVFEIAYWAVICIGLRKYLAIHTTESLVLVGSSYGVAMLLVLSAGAFMQVWMM